jgi:hypothetical protein
VATSIVLCCPCWNWCSSNKARSKSKLVSSAGELEARHGGGGGMQELDGDGVRRAELSERDAPPRYEEFRSSNGMAAMPELDSKEANTVVRPENAVVRNRELEARDTMFMPRNEMPGSGMEHEMDGGRGGE